MRGTPQEWLFDQLFSKLKNPKNQKITVCEEIFEICANRCIFLRTYPWSANSTISSRFGARVTPQKTTLEVSLSKSAQMWINSLNRSSVMYNSIFSSLTSYSRLLEHTFKILEKLKVELEAPEWLEIVKFGFGGLVLDKIQRFA